MTSKKIHVNSPNVTYSNKYIETNYAYQLTKVETVGDQISATPVTTQIQIRTELQVPRVGLMLVGWGGNNGSTVTAAILANKRKLTWVTKDGTQNANWYGSLTQSSTVRLGTGVGGDDVYVPMSQMLPMVSPDDLVLDGWDISSVDLGQAMERAKVIDWSIQCQLKDTMAKMKPRPSIYCPDYIAANQADRVNNTICGTKWQQVEHVRRDIQDFKATQKLDKVIVLWTANTERFSNVITGVHDTAENLLAAIKANHSEVSPSTLFAVASILEGCTYINGAPQNTFVPGCIELAEKHNVFVAGDDFKSGQTKLKSVLVDFLVNAGIKPVSIVSYNHLGNNDGKNLSAAEQFHSKEISKSNVVDDMVESNQILYGKNEKPDHCVVIKYVPYVGDSKRAMDEYTSELMLGGRNTIVVHNTCEDSLLASPIILDLTVLAELCSRIQFRAAKSEPYTSFRPVLSILSYLCKAPLVPAGTPVVNALSKQRACVENVMRACLGLPPDNNMLLEHKLDRNVLPLKAAFAKVNGLANGHVNGDA